MSRYAITTCSSDNHQRYSDPSVIAGARRRLVLDRLRTRLRLLELETDPDLLEAIERTLNDVLWCWPSHPLTA